MPGLFELVRGDVRRKQFDKVQHVPAHDRVAAKADPRRAAGEQPFAVECSQVVAIVTIVGHACDDADAEPHSHVSLDHVGVTRRENNVGLQSLFGECAFQRRLTAEAEHIGHQRILREILESDLAVDLGERMAHATGLRDMLRELNGGLQGDRVSDMLYEYKRPMARAMILFVLRDHYTELADVFEQYCEHLSETDRLAAAILFGAREGWLGLPVALRGTPELTAAVTHRMAARAHRVDNSGFDLGETPPRVIPLRELLGVADIHQEAALLLARRMGWPCIRSRIALRRGEYRLAVEGGAAAIDFEGEAPVTTWVDHDELLARLASEPITPTVEEEVRQRAR